MKAKVQVPGLWKRVASRLHVSAPTISSAHQFRLTTADAAHRILGHKSFQGHIKTGKIEGIDRRTFIEDFRKTT